MLIAKLIQCAVFGPLRVSERQVSKTYDASRRIALLSDTCFLDLSLVYLHMGYFL